MKLFYTCMFFLLLSQNVFSQDSAWNYVPIPTVYIVNAIQSGNNNDLFVSSSQGVFLTNDDCKTWTQLSKADSICPWLWEIVITKNNYIIGNAHNQKLYITTNMGSSWKMKNTQFDFYNLAGDTTGTLWVTTQSGLYKSSDYGDTWQRQNIDEANFSQISISKQNEIYVAAGQNIYLSTNNGSDWIKNPLPDYFQKMVLNEKGELFFAMGNKGFFVSKDRAKTWEKRYSGPFYFSDLVFDKYGIMFYCYETDGVFKSIDSGMSWQFIGSKRSTSTLEIKNDILYAGGQRMYRYNYNYIQPEPAKIKYPLHKNNAWQYITGSGSSPVTGGGTSILNLDTLYVTADTVINNYTYYKLSDYPNDWIRYSESDNKLFVFYNNQDVVQIDFNSIDGAPNTQFLLGSHEFWGSTVTRGIDTVVGVAGNWITYRGSGSGANSSISYKYNSGLGYTNYNYSSYHTGSGGSSGTMRLIDACLYEDGKMKDVSNPYYPEIEITPPTVINDPFLQFSFKVKHKYNTLVSSGKSLIYIDSVYLTGFYKKNDTIISNVKIKAENLEQTYVYMVDTALSFDLLKRGYSFYFKVYAKDKGLIPKSAVKPDTGYFCVKYSDPNSVETEKINIYSFTLKQNYPNPANPSTIISYSIPAASRVKLTLYNSLGQIVKTLEETEKPAGYHSVVFNGSGLSSGIYFCRLTAGSNSETKKLILMK